MSFETACKLLCPPEYPGIPAGKRSKSSLGLDLREFDDAITFKVALMVKNNLGVQGHRVLKKKSQDDQRRRRTFVLTVSRANRSW